METPAPNSTPNPASPPQPAPAPGAAPPPAPGAAPPAKPPEVTLWTGGPSQWTGLGAYALAGLVAVAGIVVAGFLYSRSYQAALAAAGVGALLGAIVALRQHLRLKSTRYQLTTERLVMICGVVTRTTEQVELYRVKDSLTVQPLALRLCGLGNIVLKCSDHTTPTVTMRAIPQAEHVRNLIRNQVEAMRAAKGVREIDVE